MHARISSDVSGSMASSLVASRGSLAAMMLLLLFTLQQAGAQDSEPYLIVSSKQAIYRLNINENTNQVSVVVLVTEQSAGDILDIDFHYRLERMFWISRSAESTAQSWIKTAFLNGTNVTVLINVGLRHPVGLAVDWINDKLYWTDKDLGRIESYELFTGEREIVLHTGQSSQPFGLAVYPLNNFGWLYWVDRKSQVLERASVNGSDRVVVRRGVRCPWPVTIDHLTYRVYWADECSLQIEAINMNGSEYRPIIDPIMHTVLFPYGISTLGGTLFWTEFRQNPTAFSAAPDHNSDRLLVREIIRGSSRDIFYGIEIVAQTRQPTVDVLSVPRNCTPECVQGTCYPPGLCVCHEGWIGADCTISLYVTPSQVLEETSRTHTSSLEQRLFTATLTAHNMRTTIAEYMSPTMTFTQASHSVFTASSFHSTSLSASSTAAGISSTTPPVQPNNTSPVTTSTETQVSSTYLTAVRVSPSITSSSSTVSPSAVESPVESTQSSSTTSDIKLTSSQILSSHLTLTHNMNTTVAEYMNPTRTFTQASHSVFTANSFHSTSLIPSSMTAGISSTTQPVQLNNTSPVVTLTESQVSSTYLRVSPSIISSSTVSSSAVESPAGSMQSSSTESDITLTSSQIPAVHPTTGRLSPSNTLKVGTPSETKHIVAATPSVPPTVTTTDNGRTAIVLIAATAAGAVLLTAGIAACYVGVYYMCHHRQGKKPKKRRTSDIEISRPTLQSIESRSTMSDSTCSTLNSSVSSSNSANLLVK